ncbi:hypothetical protein L6164_015849 [Bauhinia variegata]|uniref:Uncharacterized protein n=1 Tax=Bauhinia variegata TaxID=167791 RepID=A0ACB9NS21_BAUVA|nr:hypothetical protein L6164_015849 [Bauhinia variegata]
MDKSKNRTDLLAAGRKKLQQFRQKKDKDSKGGSGLGKSSKKSTKRGEHESDADAASSASISMASSQLSDGKETDLDSDLGITEISGSQSLGNSIMPDDNAPSHNLSSVAITSDKDVVNTKISSNTSVALQNQGIGENDSESFIQNEEDIGQDVDAEVAKAVSPRTSKSLGSEGGATFEPMSAPVDMLTPPAPGDAAAGTMQEAHGLDMKRSSQSHNTGTVGQNNLPFSEVGEDDQPLVGIAIALEKIRIRDASHRMEQTGEAAEVSSSVEETMPDRLSASALGSDREDDIETAGPVMRNQETETRHEETALQSSYDESSRGEYSGENREHQEELNEEHAPGRSVFSDKSHELSMQSHEMNKSGPLDVSPIADLGSLSLLQLTEVVRRLSEEDYHFLLKSRGAVPNADPLACYSVIPDKGFPEMFERLKEELYLSNFMNDVLSLQLAEQLELQLESDNHRYQLINELSEVRVFHNEVSEKNQGLAEELVNCRVELHDVASKSEELEKQFYGAKTEVEALSTRLLELQNCFEMSQKESSGLSTELADCRGLVTALQLENKDMNERLAVMIEEKNKLVEEKEFHLSESKKLSTEFAGIKNSAEGLTAENINLSVRLSLVTEERNMFEAEIEKLSQESCGGLVTVLKLENKDMNERLAVMIEGKNKLVEEKEFHLSESEKLSTEFAGIQNSVEGLTAENVNLSVRLSLVTEERNMFEAEIENLSQEIERLTKELVESKDLVASVLVENINLSGSLALSMDQSKKLEEDRVSLTESPLHISQNQDEDGEPGVLPLNLSEQEVFDDFFGFVSLKMGLDEVEKILQKLEKSIDGLHSQSISFARSGGKAAAPAVSKLIQAFESKVNSDGIEVEGRDSSEVQSPSDPFMLIKEQILNLRAIFTKWGLDVQNVGALFKGEQDGRKICDAKYSELMDQFEALKQHCSYLEVSHIELSVQCEAIKQLLADTQEKKSVLEEVCEALKREDICCKAKNNVHYEKLGNCQSKISELRMELYDVQRSSNELASVIGDQLENFQKEVIEKAMLFERGWNNTIADIVEELGKLDRTIGETSSSTISISAQDGLGINYRVAVSVNAATEVILNLQKSLEASYSDHEAVCTSFKEVKEQCDDLLGKNELAVGTLHNIHSDLKKLVLSHWGSLSVEKVDLQNEALPDLLNYGSYQTIMKYLEDMLNEKLELESITKELKLELIRREKELEELNIKSLGLEAVSKLIEDVEAVLKMEENDGEMSKEPVACLESLVSILVQKFREANMQLHMAKEDYGYKLRELTELQERVHHLDTLHVENENEILILKESLRQAEEALLAARSELHEKTSELEQSEQRVSSIREKLGIAVTKGKGLIVQRDGLKQSLAETSSELERCLQELRLKDSRLHEVETKLKAYAEAGERVEALESELLYIRNSANALRESFLLKDSVLQRIEEILEDLDLPEQFHSRDIIEKIDWLARSAAGNSVPMNDWDQKSSAGGGSYSDAGFVVMDSLKDDGQLQSDSGDDFRKKFEELQSKFYGLAEQNEMLEQSLMERNSLVQRWEELIDRIDLPSHLRSMDTEDRIEWLGRALIEANHHRDSLQLKIEKYDSYFGLLNADLEESQRGVSALRADLREVTAERENLSKRVEDLMYECENLSVQTRQTELQNLKLNNEISSLGEKLEQNVAVEEQILSIEYKIRKLHDLVLDALQESKTENQLSGGDNIDSFEELLRRLIENYATLSSMKPSDGDALDGNHTQKDDVTLNEERSVVILDEESVVGGLKKDLEEALHELMQVKLERDTNLEKQVSLSAEVEALSKRTEELELLLNQEEQKSASVREKLNVAVRKGKLLVQQRDSLKQTIEKMSNEMEQLKSEINNREHTIAEYTQKFRDFSAYPDRLEALESERSLLENRLAETERYMHEREYTLKIILNKLEEIEINGEGKTDDPLKKLELVGKFCSDLHSTVASLEQESRKSKRASELLLAELNEVQERNDVFQEELAKVAVELVDLRKQRDSAEAAKLEALSHLEKLSTMHMQQRKDQYSEIMALKSSIIQVRLGFIESGKSLANALFMDMEYFRNLEAVLLSCLKADKAANVFDILPGLPDNEDSSVPVDSLSDFDVIDHFDDNAIIENCRLLAHKLQEFLMEVGSFNKSIDKHSISAQERVQAIAKLVMNIQKEMASQRDSFEVLKKEISEKDGELVALRGNIVYLHDACANSAMVIENGKAELVGNDVASVDLGFGHQIQLISEEHVKTVADRLLFAAKEFAGIKTEFLDANQKEMKATIADLQRELQEKDIQRDRLCMELVNQIKDAEAAVNTYSQDLQSARIREHNLEKQVEQIEAERKILEQRLNELEDRQVTVADLEEKIRSQKDLLATKDQEIEALMHALDEEEMQMETLTKKIEELEKVVRQKDLDVEKIEASRGKITKKLSSTVSKFDELHHLSASLLTEVEKLQSQLQERDAEVSFLRQEVTRCTNDVLLASQMNSRSSDEIFEFLMWVDAIVSREGMHDVHPDVKSNNQVHEYKEILHQKLISTLSELEDLRAGEESKEALLQVERSKVVELTHKAESLERSLREKELRLNLLEESGRGTSRGSEILEVEPVVNKWTAAGTSVTPQVRSLRKGNNDHVAIAIDDMDPGRRRMIEDEDDEKAHGFKSLSSSRIVPRFTRRLTDMIDGLWVSCDRALMRQPALRLGIIFYWAIMHALLAFVVV